MKKLDQKYLNTALWILLVSIVMLGIPYAFHRDPLPFVGNFLTYFLLVIGMGMVTPLFLGFVWRYFGVQSLDDRFGHESENIPDALHFWVGLLSSSVMGFTWAKTVIPLISKASALNLWAWEFLRFRTVFEGYTAWGWVIWVLILFGIGYLVGHVTDYEKYRNNR